jgi:hypothetical protein
MNKNNSSVLEYEDTLANAPTENSALYEDFAPVGGVLLENFAEMAQISARNSTANYNLETVAQKNNLIDSSQTVFPYIPENADMDFFLSKLLARHRFQKIKEQFFDPSNKEARIRRALLAFSKVRVIANLDDATWKTIAEDEGIADQYAE